MGEDKCHLPGLDLALRFAEGRVLGLTGQGAVPAARAMVLRAMSWSGSGRAIRVLIPEADLAVFLDGRDMGRVSDAMTPVSCVDDALVELESGLPGEYLLLCESSAVDDRRLQAILYRNKSVRVVLIGQQSRDSVEVAGDGAVVGAGTRRARRLVGSRVFATPGDDLRDLRIAFGCGAADRGWASKPLVLAVLGRVELLVRDRGVLRDVTHVLTPKQRELLGFLAVAGEAGASREVVNEAVWPGSSASTRPHNSLHNALSLVRSALAGVTAGRLVVRSGGHYRLDRDVFDVDYWHFQDVSSLAAAAMYRGELGEGITSLWIAPPREAQRRAMIEVVGRLERDGGEGATLEMVADILERMRRVDPFNEEISQLLARIYARLRLRGRRQMGAHQSGGTVW